MGKPKIAILMDENTSGDASRYEASKSYFQAVADAGGLPFGVPYLAEVIPAVIDDFDGLLTCGGRFAYPADWYIGDGVALTPASARFEIEKTIVSVCLEHDKPVLGICAGMQMLACLQGCRLTPDLRLTFPEAGEHDRRGLRHVVTFEAGSGLAGIVGGQSLEVNSFHREAIAKLAGGVRASGRSGDGIIEAIELPGYRFAIGLQWHQEHFVGTPHAGNRIFDALIGAARETAV